MVILKRLERKIDFILLFLTQSSVIVSIVTCRFLPFSLPIFLSKTKFQMTSPIMMLIPCDYRPCTSNLGKNKFEDLGHKNKITYKMYTLIPMRKQAYIIAFTKINNHVSNSFLEYICIYILKNVKF
jgi:hypothetical protein